MLTPIYTKQFESDLRRVLKRGKKANKLKIVVKKLTNEEELEIKYRDHKLSGNYQGRRECHIEPDWLLIYKIEDIRIIFERTGSHPDLFK